MLKRLVVVGMLLVLPGVAHAQMQLAQQESPQDRMRDLQQNQQFQLQQQQQQLQMMQQQQQQQLLQQHLMQQQHLKQLQQQQPGR